MEQSLQEKLAADLDSMRRAGTYKDFRIIDSPMAPEVMIEGRGKTLILSSNNYLDLASHPEVVAAGQDALAKYGAGTASVRFICGTFSYHRELENRIAELHCCEAALTYVSCWAANTGAIPALAGEGDALVSDELNHASLIDGCRLSKASRFVYKHSDTADLEAKLKQAAGSRRILVLTDGVFSMEGDAARLPEILEISHRYGAAVLVDDSHGVGVMGKNGRGTVEHFGLEGRIDIITGTLGKALGGAAGGYVAGSKALIDYLSQVSRPQLFSNALPPPVAGSANKAIEILLREPARVAKLAEVALLLRKGLKKIGFNPLDGPSAIIPIIVGETALAIRASRELYNEGVFVTGFGYPVVPEGKARLRIQACSGLTDTQIATALAAFEKVGNILRIS